mmetsp:Transcript_17934/g.38197  ORF Transcript_17934/g.38197 Transcript_17934/m.38197 type:complete len:267 (-) Transcript_17934:427-1227(-)
MVSVRESRSSSEDEGHEANEKEADDQPGLPLEKVANDDGEGEPEQAPERGYQELHCRLGCGMVMRHAMGTCQDLWLSVVVVILDQVDPDVAQYSRDRETPEALTEDHLELLLHRHGLVVKLLVCDVSKAAGRSSGPAFDVACIHHIAGVLDANAWPEVQAAHGLQRPCSPCVISNLREELCGLGQEKHTRSTKHGRWDGAPEVNLAPVDVHKSGVQEHSKEVAHNHPNEGEGSLASHHGHLPRIRATLTTEGQGRRHAQTHGKAHA